MAAPDFAATAADGANELLGTVAARIAGAANASNLARASPRDEVVDENPDSGENDENRDLKRIAEMPDTNDEKNERGHHDDADGRGSGGRSDADDGGIAIPAALGAIGFIAREPGGAMAERTGRCNHTKW